jgi:hypothetical protein
MGYLQTFLVNSDKKSYKRNAVQGGEVSACSVSSLTEFTPTILSPSKHPYSCPQADNKAQLNSERLDLPKACDRIGIADKPWARVCF